MPSNTSLIKDKRRKRTLSESFESVLFLFILRHRKLTNIFFGNDKKRGEFQRKNSEIRPKKSRSSVQILPKGLFWPFASFYLHPVFGYEKPPETLVGSGDFVCASFLYRHLGCGDGIWTTWPSGYEPDELPSCSTPRYGFGAGNGNRTRTILSYHGILSPGRLPVSPFRHLNFLQLNYVIIFCPVCQ